MYDVISAPSPNKNSRGNAEPISIIIHCIGLSLEESLSIFQTEGKVAPHYFIPQISAQLLVQQCPQFSGINLQYPKRAPVIAMVPEVDSAWHAGRSAWKDWNALPGCSDGLNLCTIGIEFHAPGYDDTIADNISYFHPYSALQIETGQALLADITKRWSIDPSNILAHSDIAFWRADGTHKTDPGPLFPWDKMGLQNFDTEISTIAIKPELCSVRSIQHMLHQIGYFCPQNNILDTATKHCINAYRMRFMADHWLQFNGDIDDTLVKNLIRHTNR